MSDEYANPTPYKQKACAGSGRPEIDALMRTARGTVEEMSPMVLKKMIDNEDEFILFDAREEKQRSEGEIYADDVIEMTRGNLEFEIMNKLKNKDAVIVTYCRSGGRGLFAAQTLKKLGYKNVYNLKGGLKAWATAGLPFDNGLGVVVKVNAE
ncbi:MAG: sulfurtransferase [Epsilonproteobacteria bacterium]|nr:sulfurtransferase [Campylobacterota bacterium]